MTILSNYYGHNNLVGRTGVNSHPASAITNTPAGPIAATDVQSAINEISGDVTLLQAKYISQDTTVTVKTSGGDYTTIQDALDAYREVQISENAILTIEIDDGTWTIASTITCGQVSSHKIRLKGKTTVTGTISSVSSSSGSSGNRSYVLNTSDTTGVSTNDYVLISGLSGGSNPSFIGGYFKVTAVGASTLTVNVTHINASAASGNVVGNWNVYKTLLSCSTSVVGFSIGLGQRGFYSIDSLGLISAGGAGSYGISMVTGSSLQLLAGGQLGIAKFERGIMMAGGSLFCSSASNNLNISSCTYGILAHVGADLFFNKGYISGCTTHGMNCSINGTAYINNAATIVTGNGVGLYSERMGYIYGPNAAVAGNTTDYNPTVNTLGNENGYIDT